MTEKNRSNQRKRTAVTIMLLLIALLLGIERCMQSHENTSGHETATESPAQETPIYTPPTDTAEYTGGKHHYARHAFRNPKAYKQVITDAGIQGEACTPTVSSSYRELTTPQRETVGQNDTISKDTTTTVQPFTVPKPRHQFRFGVRAGAGYSAITSLGGMTENYNMRPQFTQEEKGGITFRGGIFATWKYGRIGAELSVDYMRLTGSVEKNTIGPGLSEKTKVSCDVISPQLMFRFYPFRDFYMSAGALLAIPFHTSIDYTTNRTGTVYQQQENLKAMHLQESIKSRAHLMPSLKIGYTHPKNGLEAAVEYNYGITDLLRTLDNDYGIAERVNNSYYIGVSVGYAIKMKE